MVGRDTPRARIAELLAGRGIDAAVERRAGGYTSRSTRAGGRGGKVQVLWWNGERWGRSGPFGVPTMSLDRALGYITPEPTFWIYA